MARRDRILASGSLAILAAITAVVSYLHALAVVRAVGNSGLVSFLIPFVPDMMIVTASVALLARARAGLARPPLAVVSLLVGIGVTLAMNVAAGWPHGLPGALVAALPPVGFILSLETLLGLVRRDHAAAVATPVAAPVARPVATRPRPAKVAKGRPDPATTEAAVLAALATNPDSTHKELAAAAGVSERTARRYRARLTAAA